MEGTMKAWFITEPGKMEMREVPIPKIGPKDILFKVSYAAVCGGDLPAYEKGSYLQHFPITTGHEFTGYVVEVGEEVEGIEPGLRFMGTNLEWCGECEACKSGNMFACEDITKKGLGFGTNGVFAEYSVIHNAMLNVSVYPLPDNINDLEGSTCEPMCVGAGVADTLGIQGNETIAIYGAGIIGQSLCQAIKAQWPDTKIVMVNRSPFRLELAKESGADYIISSKDRPAIDQMREMFGTANYTYHYGKSSEAVNVDIALEVTGNPDIVAECFHLVKNYGTVCLVAGYSDAYRAPIAPADLFFKAIKYVPGLMGNFGKSVQYMSEGKFKTTHLITHVFPLEELPAAFAAAKDTKNSCKVCIKVDPTAPDYPYNRRDQ
ncbi:MAG: alcohol dehydrogenase catalytic domain-containing protein [Eubacterium sp.]|nr:alcohol dehydrogenase catalytic domain-containing protein [Eubacterium sp.]